MSLRVSKMDRISSDELRGAEACALPCSSHCMASGVSTRCLGIAVDKQLIPRGVFNTGTGFFLHNSNTPLPCKTKLAPEVVLTGGVSLGTVISCQLLGQDVASKCG